jgi:ParB-like chromosome segregation protein Spo0J
MPAKPKKLTPVRSTGRSSSKTTVTTVYGETVASKDLSHIAGPLQRFAVRVDSLKNDPHNARSHDEPDLNATAASLKEFGQQHLLHFDESRTVRVGNGRLMAARKLKWAWIAAIPSTLTGDKLKAFALADNRTAELSAWDAQQLELQSQELADAGFDLASIGLSDEELESLIESASAESEPEPQNTSGGDGEGSLKEQWKIVITCNSESHQSALLERFESEGLACRALNG